MLKSLYAILKVILNHPLTKNDKLKTVLKFALWQIGARILNKKVIVPWVDDAMFISGIGEAGLTSNLYTGFMEYEDMLFLLHALQTGENFVDVGANAGAYTILASKLIKSNSIAFEPLPETVERLKNQIQINRINELVVIKQKGVGDRQGNLYFTNNNDTINKVSLIGQDQNTTSVEVTTLDEELDKNKNYFFKIDVEGFEYKVIEGGKQILSSPNTSALIIELNGSGEEFGYSNEDIHKRILSLNFIPISYNPVTREIDILNGYNKRNGNTIYVKDIDAMRSRCKAAPKRCVHTVNGMRL